MLLKLSLAVPGKNCYLATLNLQWPYSPHAKMELILVDRLDQIRTSVVVGNS